MPSKTTFLKLLRQVKKLTGLEERKIMSRARVSWRIYESSLATANLKYTYNHIINAFPQESKGFQRDILYRGPGKMELRLREIERRLTELEKKVRGPAG